jgi:hypothetical protein
MAHRRLYLIHELLKALLGILQETCRRILEMLINFVRIEDNTGLAFVVFSLSHLDQVSFQHAYSGVDIMYTGLSLTCVLVFI